MTEIDQTTFGAEVRQAGEDLSPARAGLLFARECAYPDLRPSDGLVELDDLALEAHNVVRPHTTVEARALALAEFLFQSQGFRGNRLDYQDPRNSYLNEVLDRRLGIPISLSVIYLEVGRRLSLSVAGAGLPGHFIVSAAGAGGPLYLDPFNRGVALSEEECARLVRESTGHTGTFEPRWLAPAAPRDIVARMLNNLRSSYVKREDWPRAIAVVERLHELQPRVTAHLRDLGLLNYRQGALRKASALLNQYLVVTPDAPDADSVRQSRDLLLDELGRLN